jgi:hypothetical protein
MKKHRYTFTTCECSRNANNVQYLNNLITLVIIDDAGVKRTERYHYCPKCMDWCEGQLNKRRKRL